MQRESWMLELPEDRKSFCGLEARQFRRKAPLERGDRSVWTDTPADKERKAQVRVEEYFYMLLIHMAYKYSQFYRMTFC